jgi:MFS family permease
MATTVFALATAAVAAAPWYPIALLAMFVGGVVWIWMYIATNACLQLRSPARLLGRMLGLYQLAVLGPIAIGSQLVGAWAEVVGIRWALATSATILGTWGLYSLAHRVPSIDGDGPDREDGLVEGILARAHRPRRAVG